MTGATSRQVARSAASFLGAVPLLLALLLSPGCSSTPHLMPTPNVWVQAGSNVFASVPPVYQTNVVDVLYLTDRLWEADRKGRGRYTALRSNVLSFGSCQVSIGRDVTWPALVGESLARKRQLKLPILVRQVEAQGAFPATPYTIDRSGARPRLEPRTAQAHASAVGRLQSELQRRLACSPRKEVFVFVHGFNVAFEDATRLTAQLWHFLLREGVPVAYTWPAGHGGLRGYAYDRESGEFTVHHLKQFLRTLLACPDVERVHLVAHSRGTDVLSTAVRELSIEARDAEHPIGRLQKVSNLVLIAPDLDAQVAAQRLSAEHLELAVDRFTIYVCREDKAITMANWLFEGVRRLGVLSPDDLTPRERQRLARFDDIEIIDARVKAGFLSHGYFHSNPSVSSDLLLLLRERCPPGSAGCRPLEPLGPPFWKLREGYPSPNPQ